MSRAQRHDSEPPVAWKPEQHGTGKSVLCLWRRINISGLQSVSDDDLSVPLQSRASCSAIPASSTGGLSGKRATSDRQPPIVSTVLRSADSRRSLRCSSRETPPGRFRARVRLSALISQVRRCEPGYLKMVGVIMVVEALITRIKVAGPGVASGIKDPSTKKTAPNATGEMARFDDRLRKFRCDRNVIVHDFLWKSTDGISEEILDRSCKLMDDLLHHFIEVRPDPDTPEAIALRFPEFWYLETHPPGLGRNSKRNGC